MKIARVRVKTLRELAREFDNITLGLEGNLYVGLTKTEGLSTINRDLLGKTVLAHPSADGCQYILLCIIESDRARSSISAIIHKDYVELLAEGMI